MSQRVLEVHQLRVNIGLIHKEEDMRLREMDKSRLHFTRKYGHYLKKPKEVEPEDKGDESNVSDEDDHLISPRNIDPSIRPSKKLLRRFARKVMNAQEVINRKVENFLTSRDNGAAPKLTESAPSSTLRDNMKSLKSGPELNNDFHRRKSSTICLPTIKIKERESSEKAPPLVKVEAQVRKDDRHRSLLPAIVICSAPEDEKYCPSIQDIQKVMAQLL